MPNRPSKTMSSLRYDSPVQFHDFRLAVEKMQHRIISEFCPERSHGSHLFKPALPQECTVQGPKRDCG